MPVSKTKTRRSFGCDTCRKRKIRCDGSAGSCKNCETAGWVCDGYPDTFDVVLRDQTREITRKVQLAFEKPAKKKVTDRKKESSGSVIPLYSLCPRPVDAAVAFFVTHHVMNASSAKHYYMPQQQDSPVRRALFYATAAVGLAELSSVENYDVALASSISYYSRAVKLINASLGDPQFVRDDLLLISIYTLTAYETITGRRSPSIDAWAAHVRGAATLLEIKGRDQFQSPDNIRLFFQVTLSLMLVCLENHLALPDSLVHLSYILEEKISPHDCLSRFFFTSINLVQLSAIIHSQEQLDIESILSQALDLDEKLKDIADQASFEPLWNIKKHHSHLKHPSPCRHAFPNFLAAEFWFRLWSARLYIHNSIIHLTEKPLLQASSPVLRGRLQSQAHRSSEALSSMGANILANVPQHLARKESDKRGPSRFLWDNFSSVVWQCAGPEAAPSQLPLLRLDGGYGVLRSLRAVGCNSTANPETRAEAALLLETIGRQMGVRLAWDFAQDITDLS